MTEEKIKKVVCLHNIKKELEDSLANLVEGNCFVEIRNFQCTKGKSICAYSDTIRKELIVNVTKFVREKLSEINEELKRL